MIIRYGRVAEFDIGLIKVGCTIDPDELRNATGDELRAENHAISISWIGWILPRLGMNAMTAISYELGRRSVERKQKELK